MASPQTNVLDVDQLKTEVFNLIEQPLGLNTDSLLKLLSPIQDYLEGPTSDFVTNAGELARVIVKDRNGDTKFTIDDLVCLSKDFEAIYELVKGIVLIIMSMREINFKYVPGVMEAVVLKCLMYVFLVLVPNELDMPLDASAQKEIVNITLVVYGVAVRAKLVQNAAKKVIEWFQRKKLCLCCIVQNDTQSTIDENLPPIVEKLHCAVEKNRSLMLAA